MPMSSLHSGTHPYEGHIIISPILQIRAPKLREMQQLVQGQHTEL